MPQDSGSEPTGKNDIASTARHLLEDAASEPIPDRIIQLAEKLQEVVTKAKGSKDSR